MARHRTHRRKRHSTVTTRRRHRRIGAMALNPSSPLVKVGSVAVGYFLATKINPMIDKLTGTMDAKIVSAIQVGLGGALVLGKLGGKKSTIAVAAGGVLAGAGLKRALQSFGVVTGYQEVPVVGRTLLKGYGQMPVLGYNPQSSLNGYTTAAVPMNGPSVSSRIMGAVPGTGKGSGISNGSELMG